MAAIEFVSNAKLNAQKLQGACFRGADENKRISLRGKSNRPLKMVGSGDPSRNFFGYSTYISTVGFLALEDPVLGETNPSDFSTGDNYQALFDQLFFLVIAAIYLVLRRFNFKQWTIRITLKSTLAAVLLFIGVALVFDAYHAIIGMFIQPLDSALDALDASQTVDVVQQSNLAALLEKN
ncbi:hypothetical protein [Corynebacterium silvaticum]|uniref:Uncharacterized protein n=1 Tax=Corynebacterium silvaticum TaxID=2320431 RepID=A0ACD4PY59_9CORY|nr:hypothetical protein [Corynebacterium silvaticum]UWH00093.1 hypothetical protein K1I39_10695 [Corynebacterium silvaticum]UWH02139.1 hypothetical protein K1I38_10715 [Corynebacterium silvaticum]UWH04178.1 hypothetical protein K1I36_10725 [Corynebacterium silvaticum]UXZ26339.1 hypothetical protein K3929_10720 [Corynebacterium silvaticum]UXZ28373.1 hypothetical protein K3930_10700 [Corynebacterium silvaticum]